MISRHWKGIAKRDHADRYIAHLKNDTLPQLSSLPGFIRASVLCRDVPSGTEFQVVTVWSSLRAIETFAGADVETAVVPPTVQMMMVEYDRKVAHYEVAHTFEVQ